MAVEGSKAVGWKVEAESWRVPDELDEELDEEEPDCDFRPVKESQIDIFAVQMATIK